MSLDHCEYPDLSHPSIESLYNRDYIPEPKQPRRVDYESCHYSFVLLPNGKFFIKDKKSGRVFKRKKLLNPKCGLTYYASQVIRGGISQEYVEVIKGMSKK